MGLSTNAWLMLAGAGLVLIGLLIRWRVSSYDLEDAAIDTAWTLARRKRTPDNPTALEVKYREISAEPTWGGRAKRTAATVAGHFIAKALGVVSLVMMLAGLALAVAGYFWR
jgi:hypothetical protein